MLTDKDLAQLKERGISPEDIELQLENFRRGFPFIDLQRAATPDDGIVLMDNLEAQQRSLAFEDNRRDFRLLKFVPASGAASRMFSHLYQFMETYDRSGAALEKLNEDNSFGSVRYFLDHLEDFAFYDELRMAMAQNNIDLIASLDCGDYATVVEFLLDGRGLDYGNLPKGLLLFHTYPEGKRTPVEEHIVEGALYSRNIDGRIHIHFTLSPEHIEKFNAHLNHILERYNTLFDAKYVITHSIQKPSTDTIAVSPDNEPFRDADGKLLFRPAGHGALIENLNELDADLVFIKNIDNVVPDKRKPVTKTYKRALGDLLIELVEETHAHLRKMDNGQLSDTDIKEISDFAEKKLSISLPKNFSSSTDNEKQKMLHDLLNRPVRICGMVKNVGEPGGGPFWVKDEAGNISLQVVESSQVDTKNEDQLKIFKSATHFNPVDLFCCLKNYKGKKFMLPVYTDPKTGFISHKTKDGKPLKAMELPGLWNGAMADWITVFVEVPLGTFNPVKIVNDLLREEHRG
jgi:hypothetical protein